MEDRSTKRVGSHRRELRERGRVGIVRLVVHTFPQEEREGRRKEPRSKKCTSTHPQSKVSIEGEGRPMHFVDVIGVTGVVKVVG